MEASAGASNRRGLRRTGVRAILAGMLSLLLAQGIAITGATLVPLEPSASPRKLTVLIEGERIRELGESLEPPAGARVIDGAGLFLCPAPIDAFAYWNADHDPLYASAGIALLADHGGNVLTILDARASSTRGSAPTLRIAGPVIDGYPPSTTEASVARTPLEAQAQLEPLIEAGIDFVAFQDNLGVDAWRKLIEVAHKSKLQVWGPLPRSVELAAAVDAGQDGFLFLDVLLPAGKAWDGVALADFDASIAHMAKARSRIVPFLNGNARLLRGWRADSPELSLLSPQFANYWRSELEARGAMFKEPAKRAEFESKGTKALELQRALLMRLHEQGLQLVPGSGAPHPWLVPGDGLHDELALWQQAGIAPREVLRLATAGAASALGLDAERGTVEAGKLADLVLLRADPSADIAALRKPEWVIHKGSAVSRATLDEQVAALRARQSAAQAAANRPIEVGDPPKIAGELVLAGYTETMTLGVRSAAERYSAVRAPDGKLNLCGRRVVPQDDGTQVEVESLLRLADTKLEYFKISLRTAKHELTVEGFDAAGQTRVERRIDGVHVDLQTSRDPVAAVDVGSVTTHLLIALTQDGGPFPVMTFHEGLEMEVVRWELSLDAEGNHLLRTPEGPKGARFDARGALLLLQEQRGSGGSETRGTNTLAKERPGLPFGPSKLQAIEKARSAMQAAVEAARKREAEPTKKPGEQK